MSLNDLMYSFNYYKNLFWIYNNSWINQTYKISNNCLQYTVFVKSEKNGGSLTQSIHELHDSSANSVPRWTLHYIIHDYHNLTMFCILQLLEKYIMFSHF